MLNMISHIEEVGQRLGGTADIQVGEGRQDAPVGTTIALIEQATKVLDAVHKRLHAAQSEEFQLLKCRFKNDPEAFWRHNKSPSRQWEAETFLAALENYDLVPVADPNSSSHMQRVMRAQAVYMMASANPQKFDQDAVYRYVFGMMGVNDWKQFMAPPPPPNAQPQMDPKTAGNLMQIRAKAQSAAESNAQKLEQNQLRAHEVALESQDRAADRESREKIAEMKSADDRLKIVTQLTSKSQPNLVPQ
jgi:hypothetical protein